MIQFENQFLHSSNDKVCKAHYGVNIDNERLLFVDPFRALVLYMPFFNLSPNVSFIHQNSHGTIMKLLLALNSAII
jgi:hypothetical protein